MKYLVSSKIKEELVDILTILEKENISTTNIVIYLPHILKNKLDVEKYNVIYFQEKKTQSFLYKIIETFIFIFLILKLKPDFLYTGFPIIKYRLVSMIFNVKYTAYIRGLIFSSNINLGMGDKLRYSGFSFLFKSILFNTYHADKIITISEVNKNFIINRGVSANKIILISPPWLKKKKIKKNLNIKKIVFITQAFAHHNAKNAQDSQSSFLKTLISYVNFHKLDLIIRKHPRDFENYHKYLTNNISLNEDSPEFFLNSIDTSYILISSLSTFAFEAMYTGYRTLFYSTKELDKFYLESFDFLGILPIYNINLSMNINDIEITNKNLFY